jgi:hypothetical protein
LKHSYRPFVPLGAIASLLTRQKHQGSPLWEQKVAVITGASQGIGAAL